MNLEKELNIKECEIDNDKYREDNFTMPKPTETNELYQNFSHNCETKIEKLFNDTRHNASDDLETGKNYHGKIREVLYKEDSYSRIVIYMDLYDNDITKRVTQDYTFNGNYDDFNMKKLVDLLKGIRNFQLHFINAKTVETIANSMQFLNEAKVDVIQRMSVNGKPYLDISILGEYNDEFKKVI